MMLLCVEKLVDEKYSRKEISGVTHIVNVLTPLLHQKTFQLLLPH